MIEIIVVSILIATIGTILLAKYKKKRGYMRALPMFQSMALGTLADNTVVGAVLGNTVANDTYLISADLMASLANHTAGEGPITVGIAHGDLSDAEIEECLEAVASWDNSDQIAQEHRRRKVRTIGVFPGVGTEESLNNGNPIRVRCRFTLHSGLGIKIWAHNRSGAALTTGTLLKVDGKFYTKQL